MCRSKNDCKVQNSTKNPKLGNEKSWGERWASWCVCEILGWDQSMKTQNLTKNPKLRNRHLKLRFRVYLMVIIGKENIHRGPSGAAYIHKYGWRKDSFQYLNNITTVLAAAISYSFWGTPVSPGIFKAPIVTLGDTLRVTKACE